MSDETTLFDLNRQEEEYTISDPNGKSVRVLIAHVPYDVQDMMRRRMQRIRLDVRRELDEDQTRDVLLSDAHRLEKDEVVRAIMALEEPTVEANVDLSPEPTTPTEEQVEAAATIERWRTDRKAELDGMNVEGLRSLLADRQLVNQERTLVLNRFSDITLAYMVYKPRVKPDAPLVPMLSADPKHRDYYGRLAPHTRRELLRVRQVFLDGLDEKSLRKAAGSSAFLPSGESPNGQDDSPGETIETPPDSQLTGSSSLGRESGSTM